MANFDSLKHWFAEGVASDINDFNARHQVIKDSIVTGRTLLDDNTAIKMAMEATEKALVDLQKERPKRDAEGNLLRGIKGQLNSEWIYEIIISSEIPTKNYHDFCPEYQQKITKISALPSNKFPGQKSW